MRRTEKLRCPMCGMLADASRFGKQYELEASTQVFGGKKRVGGKGAGHGRGSTEGYIGYLPKIYDKDDEKKLLAGLFYAAQALGYRLTK